MQPVLLMQVSSSLCRWCVQSDSVFATLSASSQLKIHHLAHQRVRSTSDTSFPVIFPALFRLCRSQCHVTCSHHVTSLGTPRSHWWVWLVTELSNVGLWKHDGFLLCVSVYCPLFVTDQVCFNTLVKMTLCYCNLITIS